MRGRRRKRSRWNSMTAILTGPSASPPLRRWQIRRVKTAKQKGIEVYLATNPVFPRIATLNRIKWAGLDAEDFKVITTYEDNRFCKPNPEYFRSILETYELDPQECVMVGNDVAEDLSIRTLGVRTFLLTDTMENRDNLAIHSEYAGSMEELLAWIKAL